MDRLRTAMIMLLSASLTILACAVLTGNRSDPIIGRYSPPGQDVIEMPIVQDSNPSLASFQYAPEEQRSEQYRRWLAASVKIRVSGASGSGTICHYDPGTGWAYVISCGHLWSGSKSAEEIKRSPVNAKVIVWYHNSKKLDSEKEYPAEVLFWSNRRGFDCSCLRFKPDWEPDYFPIAPLNYPINAGDRLHSCGCDGGREVAHYDVEVVEFRGGDLVTRRNSPRPGRSGGGLMTDDWYVAICWGTSDTSSGGGVGYFTPLSAIHQVYTQNGHAWLLDVGHSSMAQRIPIRDWINPNRPSAPDLIPIPGKNRIPLRL